MRKHSFLRIDRVQSIASEVKKQKSRSQKSGLKFVPQAGLEPARTLLLTGF